MDTLPVELRGLYTSKIRPCEPLMSLCMYHTRDLSEESKIEAPQNKCGDIPI